jgi:hypothetical protein
MKLLIFQTNTLRLPLMRMALITSCSLAMSVKAQPPLTGFVEFGNQLSNNLSTVNGNVGVSAGGTFDLTTPSTVNGNVYTGTGATFNEMGLVTGATFNDQDLSSQQSGIFSDSSSLAGIPPNQTITGNQTMALNFNVPAGAQIVNLTGGLNLDNQNITLTGPGTLILNVQGSFSLTGSASILGNPANILINYLGLSPATTESGTIDGKFLDPNAPATLFGTTVVGGVYGGGSLITLTDGATIDVVPEPASIALAAMGGISMIILRHRRCTVKS